MRFKKKLLNHRNQRWLTLITFSLIMLVFAASLYAESWTFVLTAESGDSKKKVSFGVAKDATDDYDVEYDVALPPPSPEHTPLTVSFENELTPLETDIRGPVTSGQKITWTLNINSDAQSRFRWDTNELPTEWGLTIEGVDMRTVREMSFDQGRSTITITAASWDVTRTYYNIALQEGINLISVPLDPSGEQDGKPWRLSNLIDFIGADATMIIVYDKDAKKFVTYMPHFPPTSRANTVVQGGDGYIIMMKAPATVTFTGKAWDGEVSLAAGINLISVPLNPLVEWRLSDLLSFIGKNAKMVISYDKASKKFVTYMPHFPENSPLNTVVQGGDGYIVMMSAPMNVIFTGTVW